MDENRKRVRIKIVESGFKALLTAGVITRKEFFCVEPNELNSKEGVLALKEIHSRSWQNQVIERLIHHGLIERDETSRSEVRYNIANEDLVRKILNDHSDSGLMLSWFVFPNEVQTPQAFSNAALDIYNKDDTEISTHIPESSAVVQSPNEPTEHTMEDLVKKMINVLIDVRDKQSSNEKLLIEQNGILREIRDVSVNVEKKTNGSIKRIEDLEKVGEKHKQLTEANQTTMKRVLESFNNFSDSVNQIQMTASEFQSTKKSIETLANVMTEREQNNIQALGLKMVATLDQFKILTAEVLEVAANKAK